jgi:hypothetical protein
VQIKLAISSNMHNWRHGLVEFRCKTHRDELPLSRCLYLTLMYLKDQGKAAACYPCGLGDFAMGMWDVCAAAACAFRHVAS